MRDLHPGDKGEDVRALQYWLERLGHNPLAAAAGIGADAPHAYGDHTAASVKVAKHDHGYHGSPDGNATVAFQTACHGWADAAPKPKPGPKPTAIVIIPKTYRWAHALVARAGKPPGVVWHHAGDVHCTADDVHRWHLGNGWSGIGYHFFAAKDGKIYRGRPENMEGAHCYAHNDWLGVCAEGDYQHEMTMPAAQLKALQGLHLYLHHKYGSIPDRKHKDMPQNSTDCPGMHYPFAKIVG